MTSTTPSPPPYPYIYRWGWPHFAASWQTPSEPCRKGQRCRMLIGKLAKNSALIEFPDGFQGVTSRNALRRADAV